MGEVGGREEADLGALREGLTEGAEEPGDAGILARRPAGLDALVERRAEDGNDTDRPIREEMPEEDRLELDRVLAAVRDLLPEEPAPAPAGQRLDEVRVGLDRPERVAYALRVAMNISPGAAWAVPKITNVSASHLARRAR